jgi:hypothetical protein
LVFADIGTMDDDMSNMSVVNSLLTILEFPFRPIPAPGQGSSTVSSLKMFLMLEVGNALLWGFAAVVLWRSVVAIGRLLNREKRERKVIEGDTIL